MSTTRQDEPPAEMRKFSALRIASNLAWILGALSIVAPDLLDLSASARDKVYVLGGLAFFVFFLCAVTGFVQLRSHARSKAESASFDAPKPPTDGA